MLIECQLHLAGQGSWREVFGLKDKCCEGAVKASAQFENATEASEREEGCTTTD